MIGSFDPTFTGSQHVRTLESATVEELIAQLRRRRSDIEGRIAEIEGEIDKLDTEYDLLNRTLEQIPE